MSQSKKYELVSTRDKPPVVHGAKPTTSSLLILQAGSEWRIPICNFIADISSEPLLQTPYIVIFSETVERLPCSRLTCG